jgi:hypothetical protein
VSLLQASFLRQVVGEHLRVSFGPCFDAHLGLRLRHDEAERCVRRVVTGAACSWNPKLLELTCVSEASALFEGKLGNLANALARIAWRPLTPRLVGAVLGISGQERARWTKDGRLPHSGQVAARRGNPVSIPTYSVEVIENLAGHPEIVSAWREQDIAARGKA